VKYRFLEISSVTRLKPIKVVFFTPDFSNSPISFPFGSSKNRIHGGVRNDYKEFSRSQRTFKTVSSRLMGLYPYKPENKPRTLGTGIQNSGSRNINFTFPPKRAIEEARKSFCVCCDTPILKASILSFVATK